MLRLSAILMIAAVGCSAVVRQEDGEDDSSCTFDCDGPGDPDQPISSGVGGAGAGTGVGGSPGSSNPTGQGGAGGGPPVIECVDQPVPAVPDWEADPDLNAPVSVLLAQAQASLIGDWQGVVTTPWVAPYEVLASFYEDGGYSAHCVYGSDYDDPNGGCCRVFYYGSDLDSELKQWELTSVSASGQVSGTIDIAFCYGNEPCSSPTWQGLLQSLEVEPGGERVRFEFWRDDGYGPVALELWRL